MADESEESGDEILRNALAEKLSEMGRKTGHQLDLIGLSNYSCIDSYRLLNSFVANL